MHIEAKLEEFGLLRSGPMQTPLGNLAAVRDCLKRLNRLRNEVSRDG
jgi:hypothetical protein